MIESEAELVGRLQDLLKLASDERLKQNDQGLEFDSGQRFHARIVRAKGLKIKSDFSFFPAGRRYLGMRSQRDPLFNIFEQHLFNALVEEETTEEFLDRVVKDYLCDLKSHGLIPPSQIQVLESDLKEEVLEMLRKKTYGHYSLKEFRKSREKSAVSATPSAAAPTRTKAKKRRVS